MSYSLREAMLCVADDLKRALDERDIEKANDILENDFATVYVFIKELEEHGYEAFCDLLKQHNEGEEQ